MRRNSIIVLVTFLIVAALAYWEPAWNFIAFCYNRPYKSLSDARLEAEIRAAQDVIVALGDNAAAMQRQGRDQRDVRTAWARTGDASQKLQQLQIEKRFRHGTFRYGLVAAFALSFVVFFLVFRSVYRQSMPDQRSRERARAQLARDSNTDNQNRQFLADRLGRIDPRLLQLKIGRTEYKGVVAALGRPAESEQDRGVAILTYLFEVPREEDGGEHELAPERLRVRIQLRAGVVSDIRVELSAPAVSASAVKPPDRI